MATQPGSTLQFSSFIAALCRSEVDFVVCGGVACILQGVSRVTADLDLALRMNETNLQRFVGVARQSGLSPRIPEPLEALCDESKRRQWIAEKHALVFTVVSLYSPLQVDVFLDYPIDYNQLSGDSLLLSLGDAEFKVSSKKHLITAKRRVKPPRPTDLRDIEDLERLMRDE